jgi:hypothetical protein
LPKKSSVRRITDAGPVRSPLFAQSHPRLDPSWPSACTPHHPPDTRKRTSQPPTHPALHLPRATWAATRFKRLCQLPCNHNHHQPFDRQFLPIALHNTNVVCEHGHDPDLDRISSCRPRDVLASTPKRYRSLLGGRERSLDYRELIESSESVAALGLALRRLRLSHNPESAICTACSLRFSSAIARRTKRYSTNGTLRCASRVFARLCRSPAHETDISSSVSALQIPIRASTRYHSLSYPMSHEQ